MTKEDLASYKAVERTPISGDYRGYQVFSMPPPSSGGIHIVQILNILENFDMKKYGFGSADAMQIMAEAEKYAYADRSEYLGDPDFVKVPLAGADPQSLCENAGRSKLISTRPNLPAR